MTLLSPRRFGQQFEDCRNQVPGWWPRLPRRALTSRQAGPQGEHRRQKVTVKTAARRPSRDLDGKIMRR
jgi:hypothetical protein